MTVLLMSKFLIKQEDTHYMYTFTQIYLKEIENSYKKYSFNYYQLNRASTNFDEDNPHEQFR